MTIGIDGTLQAFGPVPDHAAMDTIEDRVLATIHARRDDNIGSRMTLGLALAAMLLGLASVAMPYRSATASTHAGFADPGPLAPSSLLLRTGER